MPIEATIALAALTITLVGAFVGGAYNAGRLSMRIDKLEEWRTEIRADVNGIFEQTRKLERLIRGDEK